MADTPTYERATQIKPAQPVQGFAEATGQFGAFSQAIGQIGAGFAQQSANRYARLQGIEAAQNDIKEGKSRELLPFSEADKHFAESYTQNHLAELASQGQKMLDNFYQTASKTPTGSSLADYEQFGKQGIEQVVSKASREHKAGLKRSLEDAYYSGFLKLSNRVNDANNQYLRSQQTVQSGEKMENITNYALEGNYQSAQDALHDSLEDTILQEQRYINSGGQLGYNPEQAKQARQLGENRFRAAVMSHKWEQANAEQKGEQFIEDLRAHPPENLNPIQQASLVKSVMAYAQEYKSALKGQQGINYINALTSVDSGQMTDVAMIQAQRDLSEPDYAKLQHYITKKQKREGVLEAQVASFIENKDNAVALAGTSGKVANAAYQKLLQQYKDQTGESASLETAAQIARGIKAKIPLFNEQIDAGIRSGDPNTSVQAAQIYRSLAKTNPISVASVGAKSAGIAQQMTSAIRRGTPTLEAYDTAMRNAQEVDTQTMDARADKLKRELGGMSAWKNENVQEKAIANIMGYQREYMPPGVVSDFMDEVKNAYTNSPDMKLEDAFDIAKATLQRTYGPYSGNGYNQTMYLPPNLAYGGVSDVFVQNCLIEQLHQMSSQFKGKEDAQSRYEVDDKYILPQKPGFDINNFSRLTDRPIGEFSFKRGGVPGQIPGVGKETSDFLKAESSAKDYYARGNDYIDAIPGKRVDRDGTTVEGVFMIRQDEYTDSIPPSYSIQFLPKGKRIPNDVPNPDNTYSGSRFSITADQMRRGSYEAQSREAIEAEKIAPYKERQAAIDALRDQAGEPDVELP